MTLTAAAVASNSTAAYSPNPVTLTGAAGTSTNLTTNNPNVTMNAAAVTSTTTAAYSPNPVTITNALGSGGAHSNQIPFNPNVTLNKAAPTSKSSAAYPNAVTVMGMIMAAEGTSIMVTNTAGVAQVAVGDVIKVDSEEMLVTAVTAMGANWKLTVTRGFDGTTAVAHMPPPMPPGSQLPVSKVSSDTLIYVTGSAVSNGDTIEVDGEQMTVTAVTANPASAGNSILTVTRNANGVGEAAHSSGATVYKAVADTIVQVTNTTTTSSVTVGDVIKVDNEQMLVTAVAAVNAVSPGIWNLTVTRGYNSTTEATHNAGAAVSKVTLDTRVSVTGTAVAVNDVIQVDNEQMKVTAVTSSGGNSVLLTVTRGFNGTTEATHSSGATVYDVVPDTTLQITNTGSVEVAAGDVIQVGSEQMLVTAVTAGATNIWNLTVTCAASGSTAPPRHPTLRGPPSRRPPWTPGESRITGSVVAVNDVIQVDNEQMLVTAVTPSGSNSILTVTRAYNSTTEVGHSNGATVFDVVSDSIVQVTNTGSVEVAVGDTIQVDSEEMFVTSVTAGAANVWNLNVVRAYGGTLEANHLAGATVTKVNPDTTIYVTGSEVGASDVIQVDNELMYVISVTPNGANSTLTVTRGYNGTTEAAHASGATVYQPVGTGSGGLGQVDIATSGNVTLTAQTSGAYTGLTIFQDPNQELSTAQCDGRASNLWDIALIDSGNGLNGISGTIYSADQYSLFGDEMSGTAELAVITGCIYIDGANSTFNFNAATGLFGITTGLTG